MRRYCRALGPPPAGRVRPFILETLRDRSASGIDELSKFMADGGSVPSAIKAPNRLPLMSSH